MKSDVSSFFISVIKHTSINPKVRVGPFSLCCLKTVKLIMRQNWYSNLKRVKLITMGMSSYVDLSWYGSAPYGSGLKSKVAIGEISCADTGVEMAKE
ncbi:hypothetical protein P8452_48374 [Trifolium repens]|nr:hypothetical protein P8452_48374 [Trifolium repens]